MITIKQLTDGVQRYVDNDLCPGLPELTKAFIGGAVALYITRSRDVLARLNNSPAVRVLNVIDGELIDVDAIYNAFAPRINGPLTMKLPVVGKMTFDREEIEKLYRRITEA